MYRPNQRQLEMNRSVDALLDVSLMLRERRIERVGMVVSLVFLGVLYGLCLGGQI